MYSVAQNHLQQPGHGHEPGQLFGWILSKAIGKSKIYRQKSFSRINSLCTFIVRNKTFFSTILLLKKKCVKYIQLFKK